jgi:hypothetical protein
MLRFKLRYKILVSALPLVAGAIFAGVEGYQSPRPCIAVGAETLEIGSAPWHADLHVSFTDDPALATVRVALTDNVAEADFAVIDDVQSSEVQGSEDNALRRHRRNSSPSRRSRPPPPLSSISRKTARPITGFS